MQGSASTCRALTCHVLASSVVLELASCYLPIDCRSLILELYVLTCPEAQSQRRLESQYHGDAFFSWMTACSRSGERWDCCSSTDAVRCGINMASMLCAPPAAEQQRVQTPPLQWWAVSSGVWAAVMGVLTVAL